MAIVKGRGSLINNQFISGSIALISQNPSSLYEPVFSTTYSLEHVDEAVLAARDAWQTWSALPQHERNQALFSLKEQFSQREKEFAHAISSEMGKIFSEALTEAKSLSARIDLMVQQGLKRIAQENLFELYAQTRYHSQGVMAVLGPFNFPAHLVNAHVIPSVLLGNTVVIKPSPLCPWVMEIYAECVKNSALPPGIINIIQGDKDVGQKLSLHPNIDGVLLTGSYAAGRALKEALLDQPEKLLALEMGGKNMAIVMDDAHPKQAISEIIQGAFLTTGQRCTATSRVLIHEKLYKNIRNSLIETTKKLKVGSAFDNQAFCGPLASKSGLERFLDGLVSAKKEGARILLEETLMKGGAFVTPSLYEIESNHPLTSYLKEELFGPNLAIEIFTSLSDAIDRANENPFGLSNSIFTFNKKNFEQFYEETKVGLLNLNRSTNGALGQMPFGGTKKSGNHHPAGIDAVRYATYPVAITEVPYGHQSIQGALKESIDALVDYRLDPTILALRHQVEILFEQWGIFCDRADDKRVSFSQSSFHPDISKDLFFKLKNVLNDAVLIDDSTLTLFVSCENFNQSSFDKLKDALIEAAQKNGLTLSHSSLNKVNVPEEVRLPRSRAMLDRLYRDNFVPKEKKPLVPNLYRSKGPFMVSVDDNPLSIIDAASQIATLGSGFFADMYQNAYDTNIFDTALSTNANVMNNEPFTFNEIDAFHAKKAYEDFLHEKTSHVFKSIGYGASGAEANEIAIDLCRQHGPGGTRVICFEGSFHGRTIVALQATYNKEKRGPFAFLDYEATFLPFPLLENLANQPLTPEGFLEPLYQGEVPSLSGQDALLERELLALSMLKSEVEKGNVACVIIEPMQCEGGDRYASNRFFNGLRALTRGLKIPLIFDEVQTGFGLSKSFFWFHQFDLRDAKGNPESPDCVTLGKKAQLGICLSTFTNTRKYEPHIVQLKRGLLQGQAVNLECVEELEVLAFDELKRLQSYFPKLVHNIRAEGLAFAFDLPTQQLANKVIEERFHRGFMAYIAGEKTIRFRLNSAFKAHHLYKLFGNIFSALKDIDDNVTTRRHPIVSETNSTDRPSFRFLTLTPETFNHYAPHIEQLENATYEPNRRDSLSSLRKWVEKKDGLGILVLHKKHGEEMLAGYAFGGPMEETDVDGPKQDPLRKESVCFYSADITLDKKLHGHGIGYRLKQEQIRLASSLKNPDGSPRYLYITGRNRVGFTPQMVRINKSFGAYTAAIFDNQYDELGAKASQYRLPLFQTKHRWKRPTPEHYLDCRNHPQKIWHTPPSSLIKSIEANHFRTLCGTKLTLSNWATTNQVRYSELLRLLMPKHLNHAYFTSGKDEVVDKGLRCLRFHRQKAQIALGFSHQWFGNNTAAARTLSHAEGQTQPFEYFNWPKIAHPAIVGEDESYRMLTEVLNHHDADNVLGIVVDLIGEKTGLSFSEEFLKKLAHLREQTGIPLVFNETTSAFYRSGTSLFWSDALSVKPNMVWWFTGGQLGHVFVDDRYYVEKPLTLISTWDGDDISILRCYHHLLAAAELGSKGFPHFAKLFSMTKGTGLWRRQKGLDTEHLIAKAHQEGVLLSKGYDDSLLICPPIDLDEQQITRLLEVISDLFGADHVA